MKPLDFVLCWLRVAFIACWIGCLFLPIAAQDAAKPAPEAAKAASKETKAEEPTTITEAMRNTFLFAQRDFVLGEVRRAAQAQADSERRATESKGENDHLQELIKKYKEVCGKGGKDFDSKIVDCIVKTPPQTAKK